MGKLLVIFFVVQAIVIEKTKIFDLLITLAISKRYQNGTETFFGLTTSLT